MKLYRFRYSPYARKVQMVLDLLRAPHELIEVKYGDREELARLTGGYIYVPVLVAGLATFVASFLAATVPLFIGPGRLPCRQNGDHTRHEKCSPGRQQSNDNYRHEDFSQLPFLSRPPR